MKIAVGQQPIT